MYLFVSEPKPYRCLNCGKMLASRQSFREHCRRHTGEGFICDLCGQKFTTNSGFRKIINPAVYNVVCQEKRVFQHCALVVCAYVRSCVCMFLLATVYLCYINHSVFCVFPVWLSIPMQLIA